MKAKHARSKDSLTIRDHFAGRAMQGIITGLVAGQGHTAQSLRDEDIEQIADTAHRAADAMLKRRAK